MSGISRLGETLNERMGKKIAGSSVIEIDFGTIGGDFSLVPDSLGLPIPKGDYMMNLALTGDGYSAEAGGHKHQLTKQRPIKSGDRVLIAWSGNDPAVLCVLVKS